MASFHNGVRREDAKDTKGNGKSVKKTTAERIEEWNKRRFNFSLIIFCILNFWFLLIICILSTTN